MDEASAKTRMQEVIELVTSDIAAIRTGRASPGLVENMEVMVYGGQQKMKVNELGTINCPDAQTIIIDLWDKSIIGEVRKGIEASNTGFSPVIDGEIIRISFPPMTTEDREKFIKLLNTKLENAKVMIRQVRADFIKDIQKAHEDKQLTDDEKFNEEKRLQEITDQFVSKIEEIGEKKKKELESI